MALLLTRLACAPIPYVQDAILNLRYPYIVVATIDKVQFSIHEKVTLILNLWDFSIFSVKADFHILNDKYFDFGHQFTDYQHTLKINTNLITVSIKSTKVQTLGVGHAIERLCNSLYRAPCRELKTLDINFTVKVNSQHMYVYTVVNTDYFDLPFSKNNCLLNSIVTYLFALKKSG